MNLLWIDVETTGLNPEMNEVIDIAIVETTLDGRVVTSFNSKVAFKFGITEGAAKVNGYTEEKWKGAPSWGQVQAEIASLFSHDTKYIAAGWNIAFDLSFVSHALAKAGLNVSYHGLDLFGMFWAKTFDCYNGSTKWDGLGEYVLTKGKKPSLKDCCEMVGVEVKDAHTALGDVMMCIKCYEKLL